MLRLAIALSIGVGLGHGFSFSIETGLIGALICSALYVALIRSKWYWKQTGLGIVGYATVLFIGIFAYCKQSELRNPAHFSHESNAGSYIAVIDDELSVKANSLSTTLQVKFVHANGTWKPVMGHVLVYLPKKTWNLRYGDWLVVSQMPKKVVGPKNPGEFDYQRYLAFQNIYHQQFLKAKSWCFLKHAPESKLWNWAFNARNYLSSILKSELGDGDEYAVASMLIVGIRQAIPQELMEAYSGAGAMHVLAVSGMHVGLIFALLEMVFGRFARRFRLTTVFYPLSILAIWGFGFLTAFSPSVLRAVVMFTFVIIGKWLNKKANLCNALGFSAFFILIFKPTMLFDVGFQLSFMAVWGIAYLHPRISGIFQSKNKLVKLVWGTTSICMAAQLATLPLCLVNFNQYPVYALLSNLWVVPLGTFILYVGIFFFLVSGIGWFKMILGVLLKALLWLLNQSMYWVTKLPAAILEVPAFTWWEAIFLAFSLICLVLLFQLKQKHYLYWAIICAFFLTSSRIYFLTKLAEENKLVFYSVNEGTCFAAITGGKAQVWSDDRLSREKVALQRKVLKPLAKQGCSEVILQTMPNSSFVLQVGGTRLLVLNGRITMDKIKSCQDIDFVYITNSCMKIADFASFNKTKEVILPKQSSWMYLEAWNLQEKGAFEVKL